ncbi:MAG: group 1 truncated hemoglobin [Nitrospiraceae bacterium]
MVTKTMRAVFGLALLTVVTGCAETATVAPSGKAPAMAAAKASLYQRLGGKDAITAVVDKFVGNVAADNRINKFFASTDIPKLKTHLVNQVCEATGGPCTYTGRTMKATHAGMGVGEEDFNALVQDLVAALDFYKVPKAEKDELLGALGSMKGDIVTR